MRNPAKLFFSRLGVKLPIVIGLVLVWRGIWYVTDWIDRLYFGGDHLVTAIGGIIIGFILIYLPDHDFKEIEKP